MTLHYYYFFRANGEVVLGGTAYHNNFDTRVNADDTRHILESTSQLVPSLKVSKMCDINFVGIKHLAQLEKCWKVKSKVVCWLITLDSTITTKMKLVVPL